MKWFRRKKGQNVAEYAILIALVVGAIIAMQKFVQRRLQAGIRDASKYMVDNTSTLGNTAQYVPYYEDTDYRTAKDEAETKSGDVDQDAYGLTSSANRTGYSKAYMGNQQEVALNGVTF